MNGSSMLELSTPQHIVLNDFQLALKLFLNKDFAKSFAIVKRLHAACYKQFSRDHIDEDTFVKIVSLYLTELGILVSSRETISPYQLPQAEKAELLEIVELDHLLDSLLAIFGDVADVPTELVAQVFLVKYQCLKNKPEVLLKQFGNIHAILEFDDDHHLKKLLDIYVFNVLPEANDFKLALAITAQNPLYDTEKAHTRLKELQEAKKQEERLQDKHRKEREAKRLQQEEAERKRKLEAAEKSSLKYVSLKHIRNAHEQENAPTGVSAGRITDIKLKIRFYSLLASESVRKNSLAYIFVLACALIFGKLVRSRQVNVRERLADVIRMAVKVTYL